MREWFVRWRNRLHASPRFQHLAARFPLTRPIARHKATKLFDLIAGFTYSQTLAALVELDLIAFLEQPRTVDEVALQTGLTTEAARRLLGAATAIDLTLRLGDRWTLDALGAELSGNPGALAMIAHHRLLYADLSDPVALLRAPGGGALSRYWVYGADADAEQAQAYSELMRASQAPVARQLLDAYDFGRHHRLLDIGGGSGAFLEAARAEHPRLALGLVDLPAVADQAKARLGDELTLHPGNFLTDPIPSGYDLITLVRVLHDHDDAAAMTLLRNIRAALVPGGCLLIGEPMAGTAGARRVGDAYFGWYFAAMGSGRARRPAEIASMLRAARFREPKAIATAMPIIASLLIAEV